jgi:hypothetical protein
VPPPQPSPPESAPPFKAPAPLVAAASLAAVEGLVIGLYGVLELFNLTSGRLTMGVTVFAFFVAYGAGLVFCAWRLTRGTSWARGPVLLAQLIQLGLAWNFLTGSTVVVGVVLAVVAAIVLVGLFHPASMRALERDEVPDS